MGQTAEVVGQLFGITREQSDTYAAESHRRAGFFAMRGGALSLFAITPRISEMSMATLSLDRPSTLGDVVGTRLPYRGPMHDDSSRRFLEDALGACPPEILLVPITVRERVVGVLFRVQPRTRAGRPDAGPAGGVIVANYTRRFLPPAALLARWLGA